MMSIVRERHLSKSEDLTQTIGSAPNNSPSLRQSSPDHILLCDGDLTKFLITLPLFSSDDVRLSVEISRVIYNTVIKNRTTKRMKTKL